LLWLAAQLEQKQTELGLVAIAPVEAEAGVDAEAGVEVAA
jgi:hypothetical protein